MRRLPISDTTEQSRTPDQDHDDCTTLRTVTAGGDTPSQWARDPTGRNELRYWNGSQWSDHVSNQGVASVDPIRQDTPTTNDTRVLTRLTKTKYLGSHPRYGGQVDKLTLEFTNTGIRMIAGKSELGSIQWDAVNEIAADERESVERRVTASRVALLGAFALLAKKERVLSYLVVNDAKGDWIFAIPGLTQMELDAGIRQLHKYVGGSTPATPETASNINGDVAVRLERLDSLRAQGLITEHEHQSRRAQILDEI